MKGHRESLFDAGDDDVFELAADCRFRIRVLQIAEKEKLRSRFGADRVQCFRRDFPADAIGVTGRDE